MIQLNSQQQAAVRAIDAPLLVLAGAGSGKTGVITHKIIYLLEKAGFAPQRIYAVTFTNKAAREMQERLSKQLKNQHNKVNISTFHTLGLNILRQEWATLGYRAGFSIFDAYDSLKLLESLTAKDSLLDEERLQELQWQISQWKNNLSCPEQALKQAEDKQAHYRAQLYGRYQTQLKAYNAVDFDDLILLPVQLLQQHETVLNRWRQKVGYLLVDEYQDTNAAQYQLVKLLVGFRPTITVVGDDDQSIYAWRGAQPENLALLQRDFPRLQVIKLEQNYRSSHLILNAANRLIAHNPHIFEKRLWSDKGRGDEIRVLVTRNEIHEVEQVVSELIAHKFHLQTDYADYAILYRSNYQSRLFEKTLRAQKIPYHINGGMSFFDKAEVKDIMAYLRLICNGDDDNAFLRIVNTPKREIGAKTLEKLGDYAHERPCSLLNACYELGLRERLPARVLERLDYFSHWMGDMQQRASQDTEPMALVAELLAEIRYADYLADTLNDDKAVEKRMANVTELTTWLQNLAEKDGEAKTLADLVAHLSLMDILERQAEQKASDRVNLMTIHAAKGLEFPHVFIIGMEEDLLPHSNSQHDAGIEEERRLAYVGITRAQKSLTFSYAQKRRRFGEEVSCSPSRFLAELPQQDLIWQGGQHKTDPERSKQKAQAHLSQLRALLAR
jgi:ATP-dependent DNA helicase Rep